MAYKRLEKDGYTLYQKWDRKVGQGTVPCPA